MEWMIFLGFIRDYANHRHGTGRFCYRRRQGQLYSAASSPGRNKEIQAQGGTKKFFKPSQAQQTLLHYSYYYSCNPFFIEFWSVIIIGFYGMFQQQQVAAWASLESHFIFILHSPWWISFHLLSLRRESITFPSCRVRALVTSLAGGEQTSKPWRTANYFAEACWLQPLLNQCRMAVTRTWKWIHNLL